MAADIYAEVTNKIISELEKGNRPWVRPWDREKCIGPASPVNGATGHVYSGINVLLLGMHPAAFVTGDPRFCTYKQAQEKGWQVKKAEKSTPVVFYKPHEVNNDKYDPSKSDSPTTRMIGLLRVYHAFHVSQIDGPPAYVAPTVEECPWLRPDSASVILKSSGAIVTTGGDRAFYSPATDHINLPPDAAFRGPEQWSAVAMHEMGHWTGAKHRLDRDLSGSKGSSLYSLEELRAELSSAFIGSRLGIPAEIENHAGYIGHWLDHLKKDKRAIFHAAADAQKMSDYLLSFHPDYALAHEQKPSLSLPRPSATAPALSA